jgi:hypothetical protein
MKAADGIPSSAAQQHSPHGGDIRNRDQTEPPLGRHPEKFLKSWSEAMGHQYGLEP